MNGLVGIGGGGPKDAPKDALEPPRGPLTEGDRLSNAALISPNPPLSVLMSSSSSPSSTTPISIPIFAASSARASSAIAVVRVSSSAVVETRLPIRAVGS